MNNATNSQVGEGRVAEATPAPRQREGRGRGRPAREITVAHHGQYRADKPTVELLAIEFLRWLGEQNRASDAEH